MQIAARICHAILFMLPGLCVQSTLMAQSLPYPHRPIRLVVPYPTGGGTDITARAIAKPLAEILGQAVSIDNRPGATGMIGAQSVVSSAPDGYTVLFGAASEMAINVSLYKKMGYDPRKDLEPVSLIASFPLVLVNAPDKEPSLERLMERARKVPSSVTYGSIGAGSPQHLAGELLESVSHTTLTHVPYKGSGPLIQDALGGHVMVAISSLPAAMPLIRSGQLRALAVTSRKRSSVVPGVPTMAELGFSDYSFGTWVGAAVPVGTPRDIIDKLQAALVKALASKEVQATLLSQGAEPEGSTPGQFRDFIVREIAQSDRIVARARIQLE